MSDLVTNCKDCFSRMTAHFILGFDLMYVAIHVLQTTWSSDIDIRMSNKCNFSSSEQSFILFICKVLEAKLDSITSITYCKVFQKSQSSLFQDRPSYPGPTVVIPQEAQTHPRYLQGNGNEHATPHHLWPVQPRLMVRPQREEDDSSLIDVGQT